jgi:Fur family ferric uptake transcriptional regulator
MDSTKKALKVLHPVLQAMQAQKQRMTKLRIAVVNIFADAKGPLSVRDLKQSLIEYGLEPNKVSVYRELEVLKNNGHLIEVDLLEGQMRYELQSEESHHHHHLVCTACKSVSCIDICIDEALMNRRIMKQSGFKVERHILEFFGLCNKCQR